MAKRKATNKPSPMLVTVESPEAMVEATGTNDPELAQRLINQVYETLYRTRFPGHKFVMRRA